MVNTKKYFKCLVSARESGQTASKRSDKMSAKYLSLQNCYSKHNLMVSSHAQMIQGQEHRYRLSRPAFYRTSGEFVSKLSPSLTYNEKRSKRSRLLIPSMRHRIYPSTCTITKHPVYKRIIYRKRYNPSNPIITPPPRFDTENSTPAPRTHSKPSRSLCPPHHITNTRKEKSPSAETWGLQTLKTIKLRREKASAPPRAAWRSGWYCTYLYGLGGPG
jgi:hypothetical protein